MLFCHARRFALAPCLQEARQSAAPRPGQFAGLPHRLRGAIRALHGPFGFLACRRIARGRRAHANAFTPPALPPLAGRRLSLRCRWRFRQDRRLRGSARAIRYPRRALPFRNAPSRLLWLLNGPLPISLRDARVAGAVVRCLRAVGAARERFGPRPAQGLLAHSWTRPALAASPSAPAPSVIVAGGSGSARAFAATCNFFLHVFATRDSTRLCCRRSRTCEARPGRTTRLRRRSLGDRRTARRKRQSPSSRLRRRPLLLLSASGLLRHKSRRALPPSSPSHTQRAAPLRPSSACPALLFRRRSFLARYISPKLSRGPLSTRRGTSRPIPARRRRRILAKAAPPAATACCASASPHQRRLPRRVRRARPRVSRVRNAPPAPDAGRRATDERVGGAARDYRIRAGRPAPLRPRRRLPPGSHQRRLPHGTRRALPRALRGRESAATHSAGHARRQEGICPRRVPPQRRRPPLGCCRVLPGAIRARPVPLGPRRAPVRPEAAGLPSACPHDTPSGSSGPPKQSPQEPDSSSPCRAPERPAAEGSR